jgi:hypothetical protein
MGGGPDAEIDALFALPLAEFTAARNALAKRLEKESNAEAAEQVRTLAKPTVPVWAVNQLVRREPKLVDELLANGDALQKQVLSGSGSVETMREAQRCERETVRELVRRAESLLEEEGRSATAQMLERISETLSAGAQSGEGREALRSGRLSAELKPVGFDALAGMAAPGPAVRDELAAARRAKQQREKERRQLKDEVRELEQQADAAEREADRAEREAAKLREAADQARKAADKAAQELAALGTSGERQV